MKRMNDSMTDRQGARLKQGPLLAVVFLAVTFALTWAAFLPLILRRTHAESTAGILLLVLGIGAPSITALVLVALSAGREGVRELWRGGTRWRVGVRWYAAVLIIPGLAWGAASAVAAAVGAEAPPVNPLIPALVSGLLAGMLEEFGWSGLAFPALQARYGFLRAGVAMGCIVAVWHLPFFFTPGTTQSRSSFLVFLLTLIPARIIFGWIYNGSGGSILLTVLLHASGNAWSEVLGQGPAVADAAGLTVMLVFWVVAIGVLLKHRTPASRQA
jgi:membrane protease YdiL (CAAX protease family)